MIGNFIIKTIEATLNPKLHFKNISDFIVLYDDKNSPLLFSSNSAVTLKIEIDNKYYALKCYIEHKDERYEHFKALSEYIKQSQLNCFVDFEYHPNSLLLEDDNNNYISTDIFISEWIEGKSLQSAIIESAYFGRVKELKSLRIKFTELIYNTQKHRFTHGDLKPQNIIINNDGDLIFVDYDAAWIATHTYNSNNELGTYWFKHPDRKVSDWGAYIDNYPIIVIIVSLFAIEDDLLLHEIYNNHDNIIFDPLKIVNKKDEAYNKLEKMWEYEPIKLELLKSLSRKVPYANSLLEVIEETINLDKERYITNEDTIIDFDGEYRRFYSKDGLFGYINCNNLIVIEPQWADAKEFNGEYFEVRYKNKTIQINYRELLK